MVTVATFYQVWEAQLAKAFLESHRIPCFLADEHIISIQPLYASAVGGIKLHVHPQHEADAKRLYAEFLAGTHSTDAAAVPDCPACGSESVLPLPPLPGIYYNEFRCFVCDHEWNDRHLHNLNPGHIE